MRCILYLENGGAAAMQLVKHTICTNESIETLCVSGFQIFTRYSCIWDCCYSYGTESQIKQAIGRTAATFKSYNNE